MALPGRRPAVPGQLQAAAEQGFRAQRRALPERQRVAGPENFGCGSSREHAPWALEEYGFRSIIAPSYADIFFNNSFKNGLLPIILSDADVDELFQQVEANPGYQLQIDLAAQTVTRPDGKVLGFEIDAFRKHCLLNGLDDIGLTLQDGEAIAAFEAKHRASQPWLFRDA